MSNPSQLVARYRFAMEHSSEKDMEAYLKLHPHADRKNHVVKKHEDHGKKKDDKSHHHDDEEVAVSNKQKVKNVFKSLSDKAKALVTSAPAVVQKFVADADHRKKVMADATKSVLSSPKTYAKNLVHTAKEEIHEFKEAGSAIKDVIAGKKLNKHQKKAVKTVAIHMAITVTAAALSSTGIFAGAAFVGKAMAKKVAMKAALKVLEKVHILGELHHVSHEAIHGIAELMEKFAADKDDEGDDNEELSPEEALAALVMKCVTDELEGLDDDGVSEALEEASEEKQKQAWKVTAAIAADLPKLLDRAADEVDAINSAISNFDRQLLVAKHQGSLPEDRVWQAPWVRYFKSLGIRFSALEDISSALDDIYLDIPKLADVAVDARNMMALPRKAAITYAISDIDFSPNPVTGREEISYSIPVLKEWAKNLESWAKTATAKIASLKRLALKS